MVCMLEPLIVQARQLSSGTISTMSGETFYVRIDALRACFVEFCETMPEPCDKWQEAWSQFWATTREYAHGTMVP